MDKKFTLFLGGNQTQRLNLANEIVDSVVGSVHSVGVSGSSGGDGSVSPQVLHQVFGWLTKTAVTNLQLYWKILIKFLAIPNFITQINNQNVLVQNFQVFLKNAFLSIQIVPFDQSMVADVEKVLAGVMYHVGGRVFNKLYFKFVVLVVSYVQSANLVANKTALSLLHKLLLSVLEIFVNTQQYRDILSQTVEVFLVPLLDVRKDLIVELNQHSKASTTAVDNKKEVNEGPSMDLEVEDASVLRVKEDSEGSKDKTPAHFHPAGLNTPLDMKRVREITHAYATARITRSTAIKSGVEALELASSQYELLVADLQLIETIIFFGLFHPDRVGLHFYAKVNLVETHEFDVFIQANFYYGLLKHLQSPSLSGIVGQGLGFILAAYNAGLNILGTQAPRQSYEGNDTFQKKPFSQRFFINLFYLLSTTKIEEPKSASEESQEAGGEVGEKRKLDIEEKTSKKKRKTHRLDSQVTVLSNLMDEIAHRQPPGKMERLVERMRSLAYMMRVAGTIGNWRMDENEWFKQQLAPVIKTTHSLVVASHSAALDSVEYLALDAAYEVFVGLQAMDHRLFLPHIPSLFKTMARGVTVPCCDELLGAITDFSAAARQIDMLFSYLFAALRSETEFSPIFLAPKAIQKLCAHVSSLNAQMPSIWTLFLDEWKNESYYKNIQRRSRFLFLFSIFIRSVQFLSTVGFTMSVLYDVFDRTLLVANQALSEFDPDDTADSISLFRSIVMFYSAIVVIARRINPFREEKGDEVMKQNEKILAKAFPKLLKHANKLKKKQSKANTNYGVELELCELMVYRLRDVAPTTSESFVRDKDNSPEVQEIRSLVSFVLDARPPVKKRLCTCWDCKRDNKPAMLGALSPLETSLYSFTGTSEVDYPIAHWELITKNIGWIYSYATLEELKSILSIILCVCPCFSTTSQAVLHSTTIGTVSAATLTRADFYEILPLREIAGEMLLEQLLKFKIDEDKLPKAHKKVFSKLSSSMLHTSPKLKDVDETLSSCLSLLEISSKESIIIPNSYAICEQMTMQLGLIQVLPHRWLGESTAARLAHAAFACEAVASLFFTETETSTEAKKGEKPKKKEVTKNEAMAPLLSASRTVVLRVGSLFPSFVLKMSDSVANWVVVLPTLLRDVHLTALTQELLSVCWVHSIEKQVEEPVPILQVFMDWVATRLATHKEEALEHITGALGAAVGYIKKFERAAKEALKQSKKQVRLKIQKRVKHMQLLGMDKLIVAHIIRIEELILAHVATVSVTDSHFVTVTNAIGYLVRILISTVTSLKPLPGGTELSKMALPSFIEHLPNFVKLAGRTLSHELSLPDANYAKIAAISKLLIWFAKLSFFTERKGISNRFFMLLLSLSQCLCFRAYECDKYSEERGLMESLSRKMYKVLLNDIPEQNAFLQTHLMNSLNFPIAPHVSIYALQAASLHTRSTKRAPLVSAVSHVTAAALVQPLVEENSSKANLTFNSDTVLQITDTHKNRPLLYEILDPQVSATDTQVTQDKQENLSKSKASLADVYLKGLEVVTLVFEPYNMSTVNVAQVLELIPPRFYMTPAIFTRSAVLLLKVLDVDIERLRGLVTFFVNDIRNLLMSLSNYPKWTSQPGNRQVAPYMLVLLQKSKRVFRKRLESEVASVVIDYIRLCEDKHHGKSVNKSLMFIRPGILGLLELCDMSTKSAMYSTAVAAGKYTWDELYKAMETDRRERHRR